MRKYFVLATYLFVLCNFCFAQGPYHTPEQVASFTKTKLLVVTDGRDMAFDALLKESIIRNWTINGYEFVDNERFNKEKANPEYSFMVTMQIQYQRDIHENIYNFLCVILSHPTADMQQMPVIAQIPIMGSNLSSCNHINKTEMLVKFLHNYTTSVIKSNGSKRYRKLNFVNRDVKLLKNRKLIVSQSQVDSTIDGANIKKLYKGEVQIVNDESLLGFVADAKADVVVLHIVAPDDEAKSGRCFKMIMEPATGKAYYFKTQKLNAKRPPKFSKSDFRRIRWRL